jgi:DNA-binding XRE family transcriptional regulator
MAMGRAGRRIGAYFTDDTAVDRPKAVDGNARPEPDRKIALAIRSARRKGYWTQTEMADKIGVTRSTVAQWETARRRVTVSDYERLCELFPNLPKVEDHWSCHHSARVVRSLRSRDGNN